MQEIEKIGTRKSKTGNATISWSLFKCKHCKESVERQTVNGKRDKSCGCRRYIDNKTNYRHGGFSGNKNGTRLFITWRNMISRCYNFKDKAYKRYGARGITVCSELLNFSIFKKFALASGYKEGLTIDRIDNDGGYELNNIRWVTIIENNRNKRGKYNIKMEERGIKRLRFLRELGIRTKTLALEFRISERTVRAIVNYEIWKNI